MAQQIIAAARLGVFLHGVSHRRGWWWFLFWVNLLGSCYGFWWYRYQLVDTPVRYWLIVPDSPGSTLLLTGFLALLLAGRVRADSGSDAVVALRGGAGWLGAVAFLSNMKYGLWTAIVLPYHAIWSGQWTFADVHLSLSHAGMWVQGLLFLYWYRPSRAAAGAALAWMLFQDWVDYASWLHTHPTLPNEALHNPAGAIALCLSLTWGTLQLWLCGRSQPVRKGAGTA